MRGQEHQQRHHHQDQQHGAKRRRALRSRARAVQPLSVTLLMSAHISGEPANPSTFLLTPQAKFCTYTMTPGPSFATIS